MRSDFKNNTEKKRYELHLDDGEIAFAEYKLANGIIYITYTEVPRALKGRGIGSKLLNLAFRDIESNGFKVKPLCSFVIGYLRKKPEYHHLAL